MGIEQYSTGPLVGSTGAAPTITECIFPWEASQIIIINDGAANAYLNVGSTNASTGSFPLKQTESLEFADRFIRKLSIASTTTSTSDVVRVGAWRM